MASVQYNNESRATRELGSESTRFQQGAIKKVVHTHRALAASWLLSGNVVVSGGDPEVPRRTLHSGTAAGNSGDRRYK